MEFKNRDVVSIRAFTKEELEHVVSVAEKIHKDRDKYSELLKRKIVATLFFEPSTRTRLSFESAIHRMGGDVIGFSEVGTTSTAKGETLNDTMKVIEGFCDVIVMRHPEEGSAKIAADAVHIPIINGGDGANEHPTQTMLDLFTIKKSKGKLEGLNIGFLGDLKYGRTVHSLAYAMSHFGAKMYFIAPDALKMPQKDLDELKERGVEYVEERDLSKVSKELDILYVTRIQKERFPSKADYEKVKGVYILDKSFLDNANPDVRIMHPLPRVDEIKPELDDTEQSVYLDQAHYGVPVRMALLGLVLGKIK
ncbi:MAG: aspartate carbamoyltransferase [bacterium]|nr:aspartate carbamoyltransferase [bacterium]